MKKLSLLLMLVAFMMSCGTTEVDPLADDSTIYSPILMERAALENSIKVEGPRALSSPGKLYAYKNFIFISDLYTGVHVIDNSDSTNPIKLKFISIPGSVDMAIKNNVLYADNATDLLSFNISDIQNIQLIDRQEGVYPDLLPPDATLLPEAFKKENRPENTIIVQWVKK